MGLRSIVLVAVVGTMLVGVPGWPPPNLARRAVEIVGPCPLPAKRWAEAWSQTPADDRSVRSLSVFCQPSGRVYTATFLYWFSEQGPGRVVWRPVTTYFGPVPSHSAERVDIFDRAGRLIEYVFVDRQARKVEFYSTASRLTGRGALDVASGLVERFSVEGARQGSLLLPLPPEF